MGVFAGADPLGAPFRAAVGGVLGEFVAGHATLLTAVAPQLGSLIELAQVFTAGGKRLRPAYCWWGYAAVAEPSDPDALVRAAASLDLLHVSALVHDDVMDASDTRRGLAAAHRQFEAWHAEHGLTGSPEAFGRAGAILLGDLLLVWSMELFTASGLAAEALGRGGVARPFAAIGLPDGDLAVAVPPQLFERYGLTVEAVVAKALAIAR